jgi:hypothetical protein
MGLRGQKPVNNAMLRVYALQWSYLLFGLRDGYPDLFQALIWGPWVQKEQVQIRAARAERIALARVGSNGNGGETAGLVFTIMRMFATTTTTDDEPAIEYPLHQTIERDLVLPRKWSFGFESHERAYVFFPSFAPQSHLWEQLKRARSVKQLRAATGEIYDWLIAAAPGVARMPEFRVALHDGAGELFRARDLWNYPRKRRPSSDDKRIEFFAEAMAGLMLGLAPATATKKLSGWNPPKLWLTKFENSEPLT